jgi:dihydrofolate synthase/folylpolyglutamate synthase
VLVAGSNGKGSVCAILDSIGRAAGLHTVTLVKPHLVSYRERVLIDGQAIGETEFAEHIDRIQRVLPEVDAELRGITQFELLTVLGALAVDRHRPDVVVCEVGIGGRLDSTNVYDLGVAAVTNVSLEHRHILGDTHAEIAADKASIIKPDNHAVTGALGVALQVVRDHAARVGARSLRALSDGISVAGTSRGAAGIAGEVVIDGLDIAVQAPLCGEFQLDNLGVALGCVVALRERGIAISDDAIQMGCATVRWDGRLQWIDGEPAMLLDAAHNAPAIEAIVPAVEELAAERDIVLLFAAMRDKEVEPMFALLHRLTRTAVFTNPGTPRARPADELSTLWGAGARAVSSLPDALTTARLLAGKPGLVLVTGSIYLVGDVIRAL